MQAAARELARDAVYEHRPVHRRDLGRAGICRVVTLQDRLHVICSVCWLGQC